MHVDVRPLQHPRHDVGDGRLVLLQHLHREAAAAQGVATLGGPVPQPEKGEGKLVNLKREKILRILLLFKFLTRPFPHYGVSTRWSITLLHGGVKN